MSGDRETLALYDARAAEYADRAGTPEPSARLCAFIAALPGGGRALDLGCGPGAAAAAMAAAGLEVDALDASAGMIALARERHGVAARLGTFEEVDTARAYHGVWANFSLLHAPRREMPGHLARLSDALAPGGLLHVGLKTGEGEKRDGLGRLYTYYTEAEMARLLQAARFTVVDREAGRERGFDGEEADWFVLWARTG
ncbi:MAG: class I SAM-dependent methyltransferase [Paracoccaceae bacterium]|nr:class I SAM-dependent methyltransferase [Paracoccaceae bacterium]